METRLISNIKSELLKDREIYLPDLGTLVLQRKAAIFSEDGTSLYPPQYHVSFDQNKATPKNSNQFFDQLANIIKRELDRSGKAKVKNFGIFIKEEGKISFLPEQDFENSFGKGLEPLHNMKEVDRVFIKTMEDAVTTETLVVKPEKPAPLPWLKYGKWVGLGLLALALLYAIANFKINLDDNDATAQSTNKQVKSIDTKTEDTSNKYTSILTPREKSTTSEKINEKNSTLDKNSGVEKNKIEKNNPVEKTNEVGKSQKKDVKIAGKMKYPKSTKPDTNQINNLTGKPCAVITGSFTTSVNSLRMIKKLQRLGYKVYTEEYDSFTRVGILYNCNKINAEGFKNEIKAKIDTNAWILE